MLKTVECDRARIWFGELRDRLCITFENLERSAGIDPPIRFVERRTNRAGGGGGLMSIIRGGRIFEKAGINISEVYGSLSQTARKAMANRIPQDATEFWAAGISLVAHACNPKTPAVHFNTRMFATSGHWWFGGGTDLNPCIEFAEDTQFFHTELRRACDRHDPGYYPRFKEWADSYFMVRHRNLPRGVGGIFFDDLNSGDWNRDFAFVQDVGETFLSAYPRLVHKRWREPWTDEDREIQLLHRGLYAEFNLIYDRGTRFGLESGHDPDAVLMSLPPLARWH